MCLWESATSKWGLGREVQVASLVLRVKGQPECPQDNLRELMRDSNPICGIAWETKKKQTNKKRLFLQKALMLHGDPWCAHTAKD